MGWIDTYDSKLETIANYFNIEIRTHDALSDIIATREIFKKIQSKLKWS